MIVAGRAHDAEVFPISTRNKQLKSDTATGTYQSVQNFEHNIVHNFALRSYAEISQPMLKMVFVQFFARAYWLAYIVICYIINLKYKGIL